MNATSQFRAFLIIVLAAGALVTGMCGINGDPVGWIFCAIFSALEVFTLAMMLYEQGEQFRSSLVCINGLDLTFKRDIPRDQRGTYRLRDRICTQFAWLARHRN